MSLKDLFHSVFDGGREGEGEGTARLGAAVASAGAGLAELHRCAGPEGLIESWAAQVESVAGKYQKLRSALPEFEGPLDSAWGRIATAGQSVPPDAPCLCHGSFHPAEVVLTGAGVAFLDFDKSGQAEPASDVAAFTTKLRHMAVNKVDSHAYDPRGGCESAVERLRTRFLDAYRRLAPLSEDRLTAWEALELFSLVLSAAKKAPGPRTDNCVRMLEHHLRTCGM
jgi:aminoglycoside phosphotransferase (APT) family kinase protein